MNVKIPRILVIEDDGIIAHHLQIVLKKFGYQVQEVVGNGADAMRLAEATRPDLALMDIQIEGDIDGIEVAEFLQSRLNIPVVFLTSFDSDQLLQRAKVTHPFGYVTKPFEERHLHATLELALQKHRFEYELRASQQRYQAVVSQSSDGIVLIDIETQHVVEANSAFERMTGIPFDQMIHRTIQEILPNPEASLEAGLTRLAENSDFHMAAMRLQRSDGQIVYLELKATIIESPQQRLICVVTRDVTEQYWSEQRLRQMHEDLELQVRQRTAALNQVNRQLNALMNGIPDLAWVKDERSQFVAVNQPLADACDCSIDELIGKTDLDFFPPKLAESYRLDDFQVMESGQLKKIEEQFVNRAGRESWNETIKVPVFDEHGVVTGTAGIARDITQRKLSEVVLQRSQAELADLVYQSTHELETLDGHTGSKLPG